MCRVCDVIDLLCKGWSLCDVVCVFSVEGLMCSVLLFCVVFDVCVLSGCCRLCFFAYVKFLVHVLCDERFCDV